ncbi:MAG: hypothetical protein ACOYL6_09840 [Bacteriovoracaceae bacterium]
MKIAFIIGFTLLSWSTFAAETFFSKHLGFVQGLLTNILGEEKANELYGVEPEVLVKEDLITMPVIPLPKKEMTSAESHTLGLSPKSKFRFLTELQVQQLDYAFIQDLYMAVKKQKVSDEELSRWMNTLNQGSSREGVYRAMVLDSKYTALEELPSTTNPKVQDFAVKFLDKFLNQKVKVTSLQTLNIYSLKRIITEKTLEVFDEIKKKPEDFYNWYALMQADLGKDYGAVLKGKMSKELDAKKHKHWAKEMPEQHLKSEIILKLHNIFNSLI